MYISDTCVTAAALLSFDGAWATLLVNFNITARGRGRREDLVTKMVAAHMC